MDHDDRKRYLNRSGDSPVRYYSVGPSSIRVWFEDGSGYEYDAMQPGPGHVEAMKRAAELGNGLASYISRHVRKNYARRI